MTSPIPKDDLIDFVDEPGTDIVPAGGRGTLPAWVVLVVDDDAEVHQATNFALQNTILLERPLELIHASSAVEARACLEARGSEIAVVSEDMIQTRGQG